MGRLLAIDYGLKRCGIAVSDPMRIIATALEAVDTQQLMSFLQDYFRKEPVELVIIGMPRRYNNAPSEMASAVKKFMNEFREKNPSPPITEMEERFTTVRAHEALIQSGVNKKQRGVKGTVDRISATLILQEYMSLNPGKALG